MGSNLYSEEIPEDLRASICDYFLNNSIIGLNITDAEGHVIFLNEAHARITGHTPDQYMGRTMEAVMSDRLVSDSATLHVLKTGAPVTLEQIVSNGKSFRVHGQPVKNGEGKIKYIINYLIDTSDIVTAQEELSKAQADKQRLMEKYEKLRKMLENNGGLIYQSKIMQGIVERTVRVAASDAAVLITGPSGSGKEHIANIVHSESRRSDKPFIKINCAAIPAQLMESELFGYEPGAFTGGNPKGKKGLIEAADKGSLLLDEIGEMPLELQAKLLRVLQTRELRRLGAYKSIGVDFRLIASTNASLKELISKKRFREDLYYRLNVIEINLPGIDKRREDIPLLLEHFMQMFNAKYSVNKIMTPRAIKYLSMCDYPGNVRELSNITERLVVQTAGDEITLEDAYEALGLLKLMPTSQTEPLLKGKDNGELSLKEIIGEYEKSILQAYVKIYGNGTAVAKKLKTDQSTISRKLNKYDIK